MIESTMLPFPFLKLPQEIRDCIYRHLLSTRPAITHDDGSRDYSWPIKFNPAILRANKKVYEEASRVLYIENDFVVLRVTHTLEDFWLRDFPHFASLLYKQIPRPILEITIEEPSDSELSQTLRRLNQRTFIFTLEGFPYFIEKLLRGGPEYDFYYSMRFALSLSNTAPSRHKFLNNRIMRSLDQVQGFSQLDFSGDVDAEVVQYLDECMTLGQHLQVVCFRMRGLCSYGQNCFKGKEYTRAMRYWAQLTAFWMYRFIFLRRLYENSPRETRYSLESFLEATLEIILETGLGMEIVSLHIRDYQQVANTSQTPIMMVEAIIRNYSLTYHIPPVLRAKFLICEYVALSALGENEKSEDSLNMAVNTLCLCQDVRFGARFLEVAEELEWARDSFLDERENSWAYNERKEPTSMPREHAELYGWRLLEAWMDLPA
jgi:hypothetical protein